ncbi:amino acid transporter [Zopfia rhizophila CBS 207.26]|uniref:Amino acid transporter n=1 Tax=Zopfia rhizophila CBS 207.26 TaxID=1314779 RepID=A0A6A6DIS2_9PEZI|nr:amino acid transporter [Zopfia rhizophila CBS 207.26]
MLDDKGIEAIAQPSGAAERDDPERQPNAYPRSARPLGELERYISLKPMVSFGLTLQASWEAIAISFQSSFLNGGPVSLVYGILIAGLGSLSLAASLGEMAAIDPAVGAQYRWSARYAPSTWKPKLCGLIQGWLTLIAWVAACALTPFTLGTMIQALIAFNDPSYVPKRWHGTLLMWAFVTLPVFTNLYARRILVPLEIIGGVCHFLFFICVIVTLAILGPRSTDDFVWKTSISDQSGWNNAGVSFCIGLLSPAFAVSAFDGVLHMSDETKGAHKRVPRGMVLAVTINTIMGWAFIICIMYTIGDLDATLSQPIAPILGVFYQATKSTAATNILWVMVIIVCVVGDFSIFASVSRLTWAFARDQGLPFSEFFSYVDPKLKIPTNALLLVGVLSCLIAVINIGSTTGFYAVIALSTFALYFSYLPPIFFLLLRKLQGRHITYGPWKLGRFGVPINIFALSYAIFMIIFLILPTMLPVTKDTMNYAAPVWIGCLILAVIDYFIMGHKRFKLEDEIGRAE